jgi:hypothetical protein
MFKVLSVGMFVPVDSRPHKKIHVNLEFCSLSPILQTLKHQWATALFLFFLGSTGRNKQ